MTGVPSPMMSEELKGDLKQIKEQVGRWGKK
jgi:hypothetical protein